LGIASSFDFPKIFLGLIEQDIRGICSYLTSNLLSGLLQLSLQLWLCHQQSGS